jgi:hypothetical protein
MTHAQVIALVEKWLADNDSVTIDELKRAADAHTEKYTANAAAVFDDSAAAYAVTAVFDAMQAADAADDADNSWSAWAAAAAYAKASRYIKQYHDQLAEQSK